MNEHDLREALEDRASAVLVRPAPVASMTRDAGRVRRRRGMVGGAALVAAAAAAVVTVSVVQVPPDRGADGPAPVVEPGAVDVPPEGFRYVGMGRAAIAVPEDWPADDVQCNGVPKHSTWTVSVGADICAMASPFPVGTDVVTVTSPPQDSSGWTPVRVNGVDTLRSPDEVVVPNSNSEGGPLHSASVFLPSEGVTFQVESTVSEERVDELLGGIVVLDEHVGVPSYADVANGGDDSSDFPYRQRLVDLGLTVEVAYQKPLLTPPLRIVAVEPAPGTVVDVGATVTVTLTR